MDDKPDTIWKLIRSAGLTVDGDSIRSSILHSILYGSLGIEYELQFTDREGVIIHPFDVLLDRHDGIINRRSYLLRQPIGCDGHTDTFELRTGSYNDMSHVLTELFSLYKQLLIQLDRRISDLNKPLNIIYTDDPPGLHLNIDIITSKMVKDNIILFAPSLITNENSNIVGIYGKLGYYLSDQRRRDWYGLPNNMLFKRKTRWNRLYRPCEGRSSVYYDTSSVINHLSSFYHDGNAKTLLMITLSENAFPIAYKIYKGVKKIVLELRQMPANPITLSKLRELIFIAKLCIIYDLFNISLINDKLHDLIATKQEVQTIDNVIDNMITSINSSSKSKEIFDTYCQPVYDSLFNSVTDNLFENELIALQETYL